MPKILKSDNIESTIISSTKDASLILSTRPSDVLTSRLTIRSNGDVGIGEQNPTFLSGSGLEIVRNGISTLRIENSSNSTSGEIRADTVGFRLDARGTDILSFATGGGERFRVGPAGQFGIGGATYGSSNEVFISGGGSAAPTWALIANANVSNSAAIAVSKLAASTISGVTLGGTLSTLTLNVSGTGLSGSTTYNGSGAATFTVTSNATNANTFSTIVARDANGNFTATTITANLTGNVTGNVTGSSGSCTGNAATATTASSCSGNSDTATTATTANAVNTSNNYRMNALGVGTAPGSAGTVTASVNVIVSSDERFKNNWRKLSFDFIQKLSKVKSGTYDRIDIKSTRQVGVSAQSLREVMPEAVTEDKDNDNKLGVSYGNAALAACVELAKEIVALKEEIKNLKK